MFIYCFIQNKREYKVVQLKKHKKITWSGTTQKKQKTEVLNINDFSKTGLDEKNFSLKLSHSNFQ